MGSAYSVLLDYAWAKKHQGTFVVRIEDTDRERFVEDAEGNFFKGLDWLGLAEDESPRRGGPYGPYRQSERLDLYQKYAQELVGRDCAYYCFCSPERLAQVRKDQQKKGRPPMYDRHCRELDKGEVQKRLEANESYVIRLKVPDDETIIVQDLIRGPVRFESRIVDDQVLIKSDGFPTYHLAVVVDDHLMEISHIVRGEEWLSSAPKHVLLYRFFDWPEPVWLHTPTIRNKDKSKFSKRQGHTQLDWYRNQGFLPEAIINFLALLGWSHPEEREIFSLDEFIRLFDLKDISPVGPVFDLEKLKWLNGEYLRGKQPEAIYDLLRSWAKDTKTELSKLSDQSFWLKVIPLFQPRVNTLSEIKEMVTFLFEEPIPQKDRFLGNQAKRVLEVVLAKLEALDHWQGQRIYEQVKQVFSSQEFPKKEFFGNLYLAVEGKPAGLPLFESMELLGKETSLSRIKQAIKLL
jgi:glutamyl-tRNA synthetase